MFHREDGLVPMSSFYVYILRRSNGSYYIGSCEDLEARLRRHQTGQVKSTKGYLPVVLVYRERYATRGVAIRREKQLKSWKSRKAIDALISSQTGPIV